MKRILFQTFCVLMCIVVVSACKKKDKETPSTPETPTNQFTDARDGKTYKTVVIGTQTWMAENLNYNAAGSLCYNASADSCTKYGKLYDGVTAQTACPSGYHLPTDDEFKTLEKYLGMSQSDADIDDLTTARGTDQGTKLREGGSSGFNAKLSGLYNGNYVNVGVSTKFWTSTTIPSSTADSYTRAISSVSTGIYRSSATNNNSNTYCVRCLKN